MDAADQRYRNAVGHVISYNEVADTFRNYGNNNDDNRRLFSHQDEFDEDRYNALNADSDAGAARERRESVGKTKKKKRKKKKDAEASVEIPMERDHDDDDAEATKTKDTLMTSLNEELLSAIPASDRRFRDSWMKRIDYVLVYPDKKMADADGAKEKRSLQKKVDLRERFHAALRDREHVEIQEDVVGENVFVKLHATFWRLCREAERMKMEMPLKDVSRNVL